MGTPAVSLTRKASSGVAWSGIFQVSRQLLSLASVSVLARHVPPSAYGIVAMAAILTGFLETFRDLGTTNALVREREVNESLLSTVFWLNCALGLLFTACIVALAIPAARFFREPSLAPVVAALALAFSFNALGVIPTALLNREMAFRKINLASFIGAVSGTAVAITAAIRGAGVWSLVLGSLTNAAATTVAFWIFCPWRPRWSVDWRAFRSIASFTLHLSGFNIMNYFSRNADNLIVGRFLGSVPLGYYQMAYNLMTYPLSNFSSVICQVLLPAMSQVQDDNARFRAAYTRACVLIGLFTFPAMLGLTIVAGPFVDVVLGHRWSPVAGLLMVFGPVGMAQSVIGTVGLIYNAKGRADWLFRWGAISSILLVASFFVGLRWGIMGVAVCYSIMYALIAIPCLLIPFRFIELPLPEFLKHLWPGLRASLIMGALVALWLVALRHMGVVNSRIELVSGVLIGAVSYTIFVLWWKIPALQELRMILERSGNSLAARVAHYLS